MQRDPDPAYNHQLAERVVEYLQTRDVSIFPFTSGFDAAREKAFIRDLRDGLGALVDTGSARKTSATGFMMSDRQLRQVVSEWARAAGGWPASADFSPIP